MAPSDPHSRKSHQRTKVVRFRCSAVEAERLQRYARERELPISVALRQLILEAVANG